MSDRPARPASSAFPALILLLLFFTVVRGLGERSRPAGNTLDCDRVERTDVSALERCLAIRPGDLVKIEELGAQYEETGQWDRAEGLYRNAVAIDPYDGDMRVRLGHVLLRRGDRAGAHSEGKAAAALQPGRPGALDVIRLASAASGSASAPK